jgi:hypothetical protein
MRLRQQPGGCGKARRGLFARCKAHPQRTFFPVSLRFSHDLPMVADQASALPKPFGGRAKRVLARHADVLEQVILAALGQIPQILAPAKIPPPDAGQDLGTIKLRDGHKLRLTSPARRIGRSAGSLELRRLGFKRWFLYLAEHFS